MTSPKNRAPMVPARKVDENSPDEAPTLPPDTLPGGPEELEMPRDLLGDSSAAAREFPSGTPALRGPLAAANAPPISQRSASTLSLPPPSSQTPQTAPSGGPPSPLAIAGGVLRTMRPHQWVKNVFVLAPVVFAKELFDGELLLRAFGAFSVFCLLAGAVYTLNDIVDVQSDRIHPVKRFRPIAAGRLPVPFAKWLGLALFTCAMAGAFYGPLSFALVALAYFLLNLAYSFRLKKIAYVDVACLAVFFVLRVLAGGFATRIEVSGYLLACTALLALFLGFGKRSHELAGALQVGKQRAALEAYTPTALTRALAVTGALSIATYFAYTVDPVTRRTFHSDWLWLTLPNPIFGVLRFLFLVRHRPKAESPTQEMLRDTPFVLNLVIWVVVVLTIVYKLRPSAG